MKMKSFLFILFFGFSEAFSQIIPFDSDHWDINAEANILEHIDGQDAIYLQNGTALLKNSKFINGIIEFDIRFTERQSFSGLIFRVIDDGNYEEFYMRPHLNNKPDACQYTPADNGITSWQMYYGPSYSTAINYVFNKWIHVKLAIRDNLADIYYDNMVKPLLTVSLKRDPKEGAVGIESYAAPMHFANFNVTYNTPEIKGKPVPESPIGENLISEWSASSPISESSLGSQIAENQLKPLKWQTVKTESIGVLNLAKYLTRSEENNTTLVRLNIISKKSQNIPLHLGYSDRGRVYLNGDILYMGHNEYAMRDYRYLGTIGLFETVYLPLKKGNNDLIIAVSEDFGGWALVGQIEGDVSY